MSLLPVVAHALALPGLVAVAVIVGVVVIKIALGARRWPLRGRPNLLTAPERRLYQMLQRAAPELTVFCQVSVMQILEFEQKQTQLFWALFRRLGTMSVDFVLCWPDGRIVACIELDDASHRLPFRVIADRDKDRAFRDAGVVLLRIPLSQMPSLGELTSSLRMLTERRT